MEVVFIVGSIFKEMGRMLFQVEGATEQRPGGRKILLNTHGPDCLELREHIRKSWNELTSFFVCLFCFQFGTVDQGMRANQLCINAQQDALQDWLAVDIC